MIEYNWSPLRNSCFHFSFPVNEYNNSFFFRIKDTPSILWMVILNGKLLFIFSPINFISIPDLNNVHDAKFYYHFKACASMSAAFLEKYFCSCLLRQSKGTGTWGTFPLFASKNCHLYLDLRDILRSGILIIIWFNEVFFLPDALEMHYPGFYRHNNIKIFCPNPPAATFFALFGVGDETILDRAGWHQHSLRHKDES